MARVLGIDYGRKRIGLAVSDADETMAFPSDVIELRQTNEAVNRVAEYCRAESIVRIVVGMPVNMNGSRGPMAEEAAKFAEALGKRTGLPVASWDERLTTHSAEQSLLEADLSRAKRKAVRDKVAAQIMLQGYLDSRLGVGLVETSPE